MGKNWFSLLYPSKDQEKKAEERRDLTVFYHNKAPKQMTWHFVGNRMVADQKIENETEENPCFYRDLNLMLLEEPLSGPGEAGLSQACRMMRKLSCDAETISYRQAVFRDLERGDTAQLLWKFCTGIHHVETLLKEVLHSESLERKGKYLADVYQSLFDCVERLNQRLKKEQVTSEALRRIPEWLKEQIESMGKDSFSSAEKLEKKAAGVQWEVRLENGCPKVEQLVLSGEERLKDSHGYAGRLRTLLEVEGENLSIHLSRTNEESTFENWLLDAMKKQNPAFMDEFVQFAKNNPVPMMEELIRCREELEFFLCGRQMVNSWKELGCSITYPIISDSVHMEGICELGLVQDSIKPSYLNGHMQQTVPVTNNFSLNAGKQGAWITGKNHGGKTTFLKSIGQTVYLAQLGFPVIGIQVKLPVFSGIFTHFSMEENAEVSNGKLVEELNQLKEIRDTSGQGALILLNEMFSSTTVMDGMNMSECYIGDALKRGQYVVCVTHIQELAEKEEQMESYTAQESYRIVPGKPMAFSLKSEGML